MDKYIRLTERSGKGICIKETSTNDNKSIWNAIERLAELEDKIENGTLIELPCNECSKNIINLESKEILENYKKEFVTETMAKRHLKDELWKQLTPYISYYSTYDLERLVTVYKARLTIVAEVQNER